MKLGIWETIQKYRPVMKELAELNRKYKIHGGYQNHAGPRIGGPVWDLRELLQDLPPEFLGSQYDVQSCNGGRSKYLDPRNASDYKSYQDSGN